MVCCNIRIYINAFHPSFGATKPSCRIPWYAELSKKNPEKFREWDYDFCVNGSGAAGCPARQDRMGQDQIYRNLFAQLCTFVAAMRCYLLSPPDPSWLAEPYLFLPYLMRPIDDLGSFACSVAAHLVIYYCFIITRDNISVSRLI